jgi:hypothetical protein
MLTFPKNQRQIRFKSAMTKTYSVSPLTPDRSLEMGEYKEKLSEQLNNQAKF